MNPKPLDVIVCGSLHLDIMVQAPHLPRRDETAVGSAWGMKCGGKGGNQAVMAARMEASTAMLGRVGKDDFGRRLLDHLTAARVDISGVSVDAMVGSGMSVAIVEATGEYGAVIVSGSNLTIDPAFIAEHWGVLGGARVLILQNEIPEVVNIAAAQMAKAAGAHIVLNAAPARAMTRQLLDLVDLLVVNRIEAEMLSGGPVTDAEDAIRAMPALGGGHKDVVITLGGEGLVMQARDGEPVVIAPHPVTVVSTHGAGDCFVGMLCAEIARGKSLMEACVAANSAAAAFVSMTEEARCEVTRATLQALTG